jgi:hypothetical protein
MRPHWQCHRLDAEIVRTFDNVKAELGAHGKHGGILGQHLAPHGLEALML